MIKERNVLSLSQLLPFMYETKTMDKNKNTQRWQILLFGSLLIFLADFGFFLAIPPQTKIFEDILCRQYYAAHPTPLFEQNCKIVPVQSELARINGWKDTFDAVPSILVAVPYGALADRIGRKPCLLLSLVGVLISEVWTRLVCEFPIWNHHRTWSMTNDQAGHPLSD